LGKDGVREIETFRPRLLPVIRLPLFNILHDRGHHLAEGLFGLTASPLILFESQLPELVALLEIALVAGGVELALRHRLPDGAARLVRVGAVGKAATGRETLHVLERVARLASSVQS